MPPKGVKKQTGKKPGRGRGRGRAAAAAAKKDPSPEPEEQQSETDSDHTETEGNKRQRRDSTIPAVQVGASAAVAPDVAVQAGGSHVPDDLPDEEADHSSNGEEGGSEGEAGAEVSEPGAAAQSAKKAKQAKLHLSDEQSNTVIDYVQAHPQVWNKQDPEFYNRTLRRANWQNVADSIGLEVANAAERLRTWFMSMRTKFSKLTKGGPSGVGAVARTLRDKWIVERLKFLEGQIARQGSRMTVTSVSFHLFMSPILLQFYNIYIKLVLFYLHC